MPTWGYNGTVPGPEIRATQGDTLRVNVRNRLSEHTTVHWHGLAVPSAMDGVPGLSGPPIGSGEDFAYEFVVPAAGTYIYQSHAGLQLDRGLYGPLIVEPKNEELSYDREYALLLDDWLDGVVETPDDALDGLRRTGGGMMGGGMMGGTMLDYPLYLVNGRPANDPESISVRRGRRSGCASRTPPRRRSSASPSPGPAHRHPRRRPAGGAGEGRRLAHRDGRALRRAPGGR